MSKRQARPTDAELAILRVLWTRGPSTVRDVHEALAGSRETGYTTTLKLMQIMSEKGIVLRDESARSHIYAALHERDQTQQLLVSDLVDRAFGGSAAALVLQALNAKTTTPDELAEIQRMIDAYREERK